MKKLIAIFLLVAFTWLGAQVGIGTSNPNADSVLELESNEKGLLLSYVVLQSSASSSPLSEHVAGMVVYNTVTSNDVIPGLYFNNGSSWNLIQGIEPSIGDIKHSVDVSDHNGWYILDGRALSTLPELARTNATGIGFSNALPDSADKMLKGKSPSESFGDTGGSSSFTLLRENLPPITYTGTTAVGGDHSHGFSDYGSLPHQAVAGNAVTGLLYQSNQATSNTSYSGNHSHSISISTGGNDAPVSLKPSFLAVKTFIYLGSN